MSVRVRFAPSPTGALHVGGARTALYNYLFARGLGGTFILRIEDTDAARSTAESVAAIYDGLHWLGLSWDEGPEAGGTHGPYFQSERRDLYRRHAEALCAAGQAYLCYCTAEELEQRRQAQLARGEALSYDGRCRHLSDAERARLVAEGRTAAVRYALPEDAGAVGWEDVVREHVEFQGEVLDDFVVLRSDGLPTYNFACVVDDHAMEITHVIRGDDHISNTPRQILLYRALGWETPRFAHVPMILGSDGSRLSKRHGATSVSAYRELGYLPETMVNFLALLGWSLDGQREIFTLAELEQAFRLERVGSNPAIFNHEKLEWMNGQHLRALSEPDRVDRVTRYLEAHGRSLAGRSAEWRAAFVRAMGDRLKTLADAEIYGAFALDEQVEMEHAAWAEVLAKPEVGPRLSAIARAIEADGEFSLASLERITRELCAQLGIKAGELIGVMRVALTGRKVSPGIFDVIWLLGKERAVARLNSAAERWSEEKKSAAV
jgi:glutamyl-tRNA synthetase